MNKYTVIIDDDGFVGGVAIGWFAEENTSSNIYRISAPNDYFSNLEIIPGKTKFEYISENNFSFYTTEDDIFEFKRDNQLSFLRSSRPLLLQAFDLWEKAVVRR